MTVPVSHAEVIDALESVNDPHIPASLRKMGMLAAVDVSPDGEVRVSVRVPCTACPGASLIEGQVTDRLAALPGVTGVVVDLEWHLPWDRDLIDRPTKDLMRVHGIQV